MFEFLFVLAGLPIVYPINKIRQLKDINIFDLCILFSVLYFWIVPARDFLINHVFPDLVGHISTVVALNIYMWLLLLFAVTTRGNNMFNITRSLSNLSVLKVSDKFLWFLLIFSLFYFYKATDYSSLTEDNFEGNNTWTYGFGLPWPLMIIVKSCNPSLSSFLLITFFMRPITPFYKRMRMIVLVILSVTLMLGGKTLFICIAGFLLLYAYSKYRDKIKKKHFIGLFIGLFICFSFYFPLNQSFRYYKQFSVKNSTNHGFVATLKGFMEDDGISYDIKERVEAYQNGRSMNLYNAFDWACISEWKGDGQMTWAIFRYIIPQRMIHDQWGNIMGYQMSGGGEKADVAESILSWFVADYGPIIGPIIAVLYFMFIAWTIIFFGRMFARWYKSPMILFLVYSLVFFLSVRIENNPVQDIKRIYSLWPFMYGLLSMIYYVFRRKSPQVSIASK